MPIKNKPQRSPPRPRVHKYGMLVDASNDPLYIELYCIAKGGRWKPLGSKPGAFCGEGLEYHYSEAIRLIWPDIVQHRWFKFFLKHWLENKYVGVLGPSSSGKTLCAAVCHLINYYCFSHCSTTLVCSTTRESLENRIWGEIKRRDKEAKLKYPWLPGHLIESRLRLVTDNKEENTEGRDFRNGMCGVPCKKGNSYVGMGEFIGIKNKHVLLCGDELQLLPKAFIDSIANLSGNLGLKVTGMGNPKETTDSLGLLCEPESSLGGWDGGIDQRPKTKAWATRWKGGICIQLPGSDSPNFDKANPSDPDPYPFLIGEAKLKEDASIWGADDWHYTMFDEGRMPRGQGSRRVITRRMCEKGGALLEPSWRDTAQTQIACLDAAYRAVGGDRCVFMRVKFGAEAAVDVPGEFNVSALIAQEPAKLPGKIILALVETRIVPIESTPGHAGLADDAEDQIVKFVMNECRTYGISANNFFFDSGMRTSLVSAFGRLWSPNVNSIDCGGPPSERKVSGGIDVLCKDYYSKRITEFWYSVRLAIEAGQIRGMTQELMLEGCQREFKKVGANKIEVESKKEMKLKTGRSPDLFDCFAVGLEGARQRGFNIAKMEAVNEERETDDRWKEEIKERSRRFWRIGALHHQN